MSKRQQRAPASAGARGASDPFSVALAAVRDEREEALATLALIEAAVIKARTLPRADAVRLLDAAGSLEHELGLAERDCACDVLLEDAFGDRHNPQGEVIEVGEARAILKAMRGTP
ncbi:MAG: hypothetical protein JW940_29760 [Polyangiaceae bacterium]|nr:hypothetical protein [Polyangiaceae bacterium]